MEQKLFVITKQQHNRRDGNIGVLKNMVVYDILPDGLKKQVRYYSSYKVKTYAEFAAKRKAS